MYPFNTTSYTKDYRASEAVTQCTIAFCNIGRRRLHGGDEGDHPHSQQVCGAMPPCRTTGIYVHFWTRKRVPNG